MTRFCEFVKLGAHGGKDISRSSRWAEHDFKAATGRNNECRGLIVKGCGSVSLDLSMYASLAKYHNCRHQDRLSSRLNYIGSVCTH